MKQITGFHRTAVTESGNCITKFLWPVKLMNAEGGVIEKANHNRVILVNTASMLTGACTLVMATNQTNFRYSRPFRHEAPKDTGFCTQFDWHSKAKSLQNNTNTYRIF